MTRTIVRETTTDMNVNQNKEKQNKSQKALKLIMKQYEEIMFRLTNIESIMGEIQDATVSMEDSMSNFEGLENLNKLSNLSSLNNLTKTMKEVSESVKSTDTAVKGMGKKLDTCIDSLTLTTSQQNSMKRFADMRIKELLGDNTKEYAVYKHKYLLTLWYDFRVNFGCQNSWKELNPMLADIAGTWISKWMPTICDEAKVKGVSKEEIKKSLQATA